MRKPNTGVSDRLLTAAGHRLREFGITLEPESLGNAGVDTDALVTLSRGKATARYTVIAKEPMTLASVAHRTFPVSPYPLLVIGDRITRRSATTLRDAGIQFVDTLGNAFITFESVFVEVQGRTEHPGHVSDGDHRETRPPQPANIFSPRRSQVILALLTWPEIADRKVREIAKVAGVSVGQAHDALAQLQQAGFLVPASRRLDRTSELLDYWTAAYLAGLGRRLELAAYHGEPSRPMRKPRAEQPIYLSGESAAGTDIARPATLTIYLDALDPTMPAMNRWSSRPDRVPNVFVRHKFWVSPHPEEEGPAAEERNAPWPLVYADLVATGDARLGEVARAWRARCARPHEV